MIPIFYEKDNVYSGYAKFGPWVGRTFLYKSIVELINGQEQNNIKLIFQI